MNALQIKFGILLLIAISSIDGPVLSEEAATEKWNGLDEGIKKKLLIHSEEKLEKIEDGAEEANTLINDPDYVYEYSATGEITDVQAEEFLTVVQDLYEG